MKTILIADPEPVCRRQIRQHISRRPGLRVVGECDNRHETIRYVNALEPDVLFLDVRLGGNRALDLAQQTDHLPDIIYTSDGGSHAFRAFAHQALDCLLKPFQTAQIEAALQKVASHVATDAPTRNALIVPTFRSSLFVEDGDRLRRISLGDIQYFKAAGDYTVVYTANGEYLSSSGIGSIETKLDPMLFVRVHRSFIVNIEHIDTCYRDIGKLFLVMENQQEISVGRHYLNSIKALIL